MNSILVECNLQVGPSTSDYIQQMIGRMAKNCEYVNEEYRNVSGATNLELRDMSSIQFVIVEVIADAGGASYLTVQWTDKTSGASFSTRVYKEDGNWGGIHSCCIPNHDPDENLALTPDAGNVDVRIIVAGDL